MAYVHRLKPTSITMDFCISYFKSLFDEGLAASTINTNKSAITKPINYAFNINFNTELFNNIPKSCAALNPGPPPKPISWSLGKVLELAVSIENETASVKRLSQKCLFLLAMASGARLSEIVALVRGEGNIQYLDSGHVLLYPDSVFLAKNELPNNRWGPWRIPSLQEEPSLCPVACLKRYLQVTSHLREGQIFRGDEGSKLSLKQVRAKLLYFIQSADPNSVPAGHDCRKVATSINFFEFMNFEGLTSYTGWKSPRVFYRNYLKSVEDVRYSLVAAGRVVHPTTSASE